MVIIILKVKVKYCPLKVLSSFSRGPVGAGRLTVNLSSPECSECVSGDCSINTPVSEGPRTSSRVQVDADLPCQEVLFCSVLLTGAGGEMDFTS